MKKNTIFIILILMATLSFSQTPKKSESVLINGKNIYYEIYGKGDPTGRLAKTFQSLFRMSASEKQMIKKSKRNAWTRAY